MKIFVKTMSGKTITLDILENTTIEKIRNRLVAKEERDLKTVFLVANGKVLVDTDTIIIKENESPHIYSESAGRLNFSGNSISIHLVDKASLNPAPNATNIAPLATTSNNSTSNLWQRNKLSLITAGISTAGATALVFAVLFPPTGFVISSTLALGLLTTAGGLTFIAGVLLFKIRLNEQRPHLTKTPAMNDPSPLPRGWQPSNDTCKRYIMLDHGGVLDGEMYEGNIDALDANDLVLNEVYPGLSMILKNGVTILSQLSDLVAHHNFRLVFHSKNREADQQRVWQQIKSAATAKSVQLPPLFAMIVYDANQYLDNLPESPSVTISDEGTTVIGYGQGEGDGKSCVRQALSSVYAIDISARENCFVFDDGASVIDSARSEGYQAYLIGAGLGALTLADAINNLYDKIRALAGDNSPPIQQPGSLSVFAQPIQSVTDDRSSVMENAFK